MSSKKLNLSILIFSLLFLNKAYAKDTDPFITQKQAKDFFTGFGIGMTHGLINRSIESAYPLGNTPGFVYPITYTIAECGSIKMNGYNNGSHELGRGVGQFITESIVIEKNNNNTEVKINARLNVSLIFSLLSLFSKK